MKPTKHYSEEHNPECTRLYWKSDKERINEVLYKKLDLKQLLKLISICRDKNNPNRSYDWDYDKPNRTPVMVRTAGVEIFATLGTLKKVYRKRMGCSKDFSKIDYYSNSLYSIMLKTDSPSEKAYLQDLWLKCCRESELSEEDEEKIKKVIKEKSEKKNVGMISICSFCKYHTDELCEKGYKNLEKTNCNHYDKK